MKRTICILACIFLLITTGCSSLNKQVKRDVDTYDKVFAVDVERIRRLVEVKHKIKRKELQKPFHCYDHYIPEGDPLTPIICIMLFPIILPANVYCKAECAVRDLWPEKEVEVTSEEGKNIYKTTLNNGDILYLESDLPIGVPVKIYPTSWGKVMTKDGKVPIWSATFDTTP